MTINLNERYEHPIIIAGVVARTVVITTAAGAATTSPDQAAPRIKDVRYGPDPDTSDCAGWNGWCFDIKLQEPPCADGLIEDPGEALSWVAVDRGTYHLHGGQRDHNDAPIEDLQFQAGTIWAQGNAFFVVAPTPFMRADPIVVTQVQTYLDENFVKVRQKKATGYMGGFFEVKLEPHQGAQRVHNEEQIGYLAIEPSYGTIGKLRFEAEMTPRNMNHRVHRLSFKRNYTSEPLVFGSIASFFGRDPAVLRQTAEGLDHVELSIQEDNCGSTTNNAHAGEQVAMIVIDAGVIYADRDAESAAHCAASNTWFSFVEMGQFVSWSMAKRAAEAHGSLGPTGRRDNSAHLATISSPEEQQCLVDVAEIVRKTGQVGVGWIGGTDAEFVLWEQQMLVHRHGDPTFGQSSAAGWTVTGATIYGWLRHAPGSPNAVGAGTLSRTASPVEAAYVASHCDTVDQLRCVCGGLGDIIGGYGKLGHNMSVQKTFGIAPGTPLPTHSKLRIELDFLRIDSWDGEHAYMYADDVLVWDQTLSHTGGANLCGSTYSDQVYHITKTISHSSPTVTLTFNTSLDQGVGDESFGLQNIAISWSSSQGTNSWKWFNNDKWDGLTASSAWHVGKPVDNDNAHFAAADWPSYLPGQWHDCESESQKLPPTWPRCVYGVRSIAVPNRAAMGPTARVQNIAMLAQQTTQWPSGNEFAVTAVLTVTSAVSATAVSTEWLSVFQVHGANSGFSPGVWIKPNTKQLDVRTSTRSDLNFGCLTDNVPALGTTTKVHLGISVETIASATHLTVYVNGVPSGNCSSATSPSRIIGFDGPLYIGGDSQYAGFQGVVDVLCMHPNKLEAATMVTRQNIELKQVTDAVITAGAAAAGSVTALSNGHMLFNLAMPFRRDWLDPLHGGHSVDSMLIPARALSWGYTQLGLIKIRPSSNDFSIEVKVHVDTGHTGRWRNIFHLGRHIVMLHPQNMRVLVGVIPSGAGQPSTAITASGGYNTNGVGYSCFSDSEIFVDEDVSLVYTYVHATGQISFSINGCADSAATGCSLSISRGCKFTLNPTARSMLTNDVSLMAADTGYSLLLGDVSPADALEHGGNTLDIPGFKGTLRRFVLHDATLSSSQVMDLYSAECGKHLHGYYVEYAHKPPVHHAVGGMQSSTSEQDDCPAECWANRAATVLFLAIALICCCLLGYVFYEKPPKVDVPGDAFASSTSGFNEMEMSAMLPPTEPTAFDDETASLRSGAPPMQPAVKGFEVGEYASMPTVDSTAPSRSLKPAPSLNALSPNALSGKRTLQNAVRSAGAFRSTTPNRGRVGATQGDVPSSHALSGKRTLQNAVRSAGAFRSTTSNPATQGAPALPARAGTPPRGAAPPLQQAAGPTRLSPARGRGGSELPADSEVRVGGSVRGMRDAFAQGVAPGASLSELQGSGGRRVRSPARRGAAPSLGGMASRSSSRAGSAGGIELEQPVGSTVQSTAV